MKKLFALLIALLLLLAGCANGDAEQTETTTPIETLPAGYYEADSQLELQTGGAVRQYVLPDAGYRWIKSVGDRLLLATDTDLAKLHIISGDLGIPVATEEIESVALDSCEALFNSFAYYDTSDNVVVYLDPQLKQMQTISLPADAANPVISRGGDQIFYCFGNEIRALDIARKLSRLIKTLSVEKQTLVGTCFEGKILVCNVENSSGITDTLYISTETGQTVRVENDILALYTYEDSYLAERMDGTVRQRIAGTLNGDAKQLNVDDDYVVGALELGGVVGYCADEAGLQLNYYNITSGKKTASVALPGITQPQAFLADRWSGCVWILASNGSQTLLLRWDVRTSNETDDETYIGTLFTAQNPDTASLETLIDRVSALNKKYGVRIRIWKDAVKVTGGHSLVPEHQISAITDMLDNLESVLAEFPKSFISKSISSKVRICLVRSINGKIEGTQYWDGSNAYIALSVGVDVRSEFLKAFGFVIDSHVLGNSAKYDYWDTLNPSGFIYGGAEDESLATGEGRAFVDVDSMSSGTIDRSHVFWQAMQPDNADMFQNETMQKKLKMLCQAIRDAWNLKKSTETYPWEQYLSKSIAYKKK